VNPSSTLAIPDYRFATDGIDGTSQVYMPSAVAPGVILGAHTVIWRYVTILAGTVIGDACLIADCVSIGRHVVVGNGCRIQHGAAICDGAVLGDQVFIGSNVSILDTKYPDLGDRTTEVHQPPVIEDEVSIGCNAVILPGVVVHRGAVVGAGSVVTKDVAARSVVQGNPARLCRRL